MIDDPSGWGELLSALAAFGLAHSIPARPAVRARLVAVAGRRTYLIAYSAVSILILVWLIAAAAATPYVELWARDDWQALAPRIAMAAACVLAVFGLTSANPLSLGGFRNEAFDPERPGIAGVVRHPVLWAALIWATSHLVPNGDLSHLMVFGFFALLALGGMIVLDRRARRTLGVDRWRELARNTSNIPLLGLREGGRLAIGWGTLLRLGLATALYVALVATHGTFAGVPVA